MGSGSRPPAEYGFGLTIDEATYSIRMFGRSEDDLRAKIAVDFGRQMSRYHRCLDEDQPPVRIEWGRVTAWSISTPELLGRRGRRRAEPDVATAAPGDRVVVQLQRSASRRARLDGDAGDGAPATPSAGALAAAVGAAVPDATAGTQAATGGAVPRSARVVGGESDAPLLVLVHSSSGPSEGAQRGAQAPEADVDRRDAPDHLAVATGGTAARLSG